jgi:ubiquinol-cytochrome c reductase cytochrome c1 subunit
MLVRIGAFFVGLAFVGVALFSFLTGAIAFVGTPAEKNVQEEFHLHPRHFDVSSNGPFGTFDRRQLQRGFQVYKEVCAACHSLNYVSIRDVSALGYDEAEVKAIANQWQIEVPDVNPDTGEPSTRKATPADRFPSPYANEVAARSANNNALPPDLSLIVKARESGSDYVYSLLTGYRPVPKNLPAEARPGPGLHYNPYFHNLNIAMPPPLTSDGQVTYADGTKSTVDQMAKDVAAFLIWTAEPKMENRHRTGWAALIFLAIATLLGYLAYRNVWRDLKAKPVAYTGTMKPENRERRDEASREAGLNR